MSRLVRIGEKMVELSGLRSIWLGTCHLGGSRITLFYPNRPSGNNTDTIEYDYGKWAQAEKDKKVLEEALKELSSKH
jgi:hypothetical protein